MIPMCSRRHEPAINQEVGEELHQCGFCGTRTEPDISKPGGPNWETANVCPHCEQTYYLTDEQDEEGDELVSFGPDDLGEIEVVDERTGEVVGTTAAPEGKLERATDKLKARLARLRAEEGGGKPAVLSEASQADLNHLFGIKPSPYGDEFGSFG